MPAPPLQPGRSEIEEHETAAARAPPVKSGAVRGRSLEPAPRSVADPLGAVRADGSQPAIDDERAAAAMRRRAWLVGDGRQGRQASGRVGPAASVPRRHDPADAIGAASSKRHDLASWPADASDSDPSDVCVPRAADRGS